MPAGPGRGLKRVLAENDRVREEILAIEMAQETMTELSHPSGIPLACT